MEIKKLKHKKESDPQVLKNSCYKNLISLLQTIKKYCSKNHKKNMELFEKIVNR